MPTKTKKAPTKPARRSAGPYDHMIGKLVAVRTVTMIDTGILRAVYPTELVLTDAAWIADTARWAEFVASGVANEVEPFPDGHVVVGRGAVIDVCLVGGTPHRSQR